MSKANLTELGRQAAAKIWDEAAEADAIADPRAPAFASGVIAGFAEILASAPGTVRKLFGHASAAAEDLNVEPFHGIVEVLQNADDLGATEARILIQAEGENRKLLIVHNGRPVTCHHVLPMILPYLTTKSGDARQKGRFGIGLKTLRRISTRMEVHCAPYHFSADGMQLTGLEAMAAIEGIYDPQTDTMLALDLAKDFDPESLLAWLKDFSPRNLLFLDHLETMSWLDGQTGQAKVLNLQRTKWEQLGPESALQRRTVNSTGGRWTIYRATLATPSRLARSHKATGASTRVSIAISNRGEKTGIFIGFPTRVPVSLPFSIDAQFDPSTAREGLIDNPWNRWLIAKCGEVLSSMTGHLLQSDPAAAWLWIPLPFERAGVETEAWPTKSFDEGFEGLRSRLANEGLLRLSHGAIPLRSISYESEELDGLLGLEDVEALHQGTRAIEEEARDRGGRWRDVLAAIGVSKQVGVPELIEGFRKEAFKDHSVPWWIDAGVRLARHANPDDIFSVPCWLSDKEQPFAAGKRGLTERPLVIGPELSDFARRWALFHRLHPDYSSSAGEPATDWLHKHAAISALVDERAELAAFGETHAADPVTPNDDELREIRNRFDQVPDRAAAQIGEKVGRAVLLDGFAYRGTKRVFTKVSPANAYLPRTLDNDYPHWPEAAGKTGDIVWLAPSYDERLKTAAKGRSARRRDDGTVSRGPRKFLLLLGAACAPRVLKVGRLDGGGSTRQRDLRRQNAEFVEEDYSSPDLERVTASIIRAASRDRRTRSAALIKSLSRHWPNYQGKLRTRAWHMAYIHKHMRGEIDADWLCRLRDRQWVVLSSGALRSPEHAIVKTQETQAAYAANSFIAGIAGEDVNPSLAAALKLITDVRPGDLVSVLEEMKAGGEPPNPGKALQAYRALARHCPQNPSWNSAIGDLSLFELQRRFGAGDGLVLAQSPNAAGAAWRKPSELFIGRDLLHAPERFAPGGPACSRLWIALGMRPPSLDDCIARLNELAISPLSPASEAALIDIYRYLDPLVLKADRRQKAALRMLPVGVELGWTSGRPVFRVDDRELRGRLARARPDVEFWHPPCDVHALQHLTVALDLTNISPRLRIADNPGAREAGEAQRLRFQACVDHLANELARNDPVAREQLGITWAAFRDLPLSVYEGPFNVMAEDPHLSRKAVPIEMEAVLMMEPFHLHISASAFPRRDRGGRAVAQLFAPNARHRVEAEWVASWVASADAEVQRMSLASDEEVAQALADQADKIKVSPDKKIKVSPPASRSKKEQPPRELKSGHGGVVSVEVMDGSPPKPAGPRKPLSTKPPAPSPFSPNPTPGAPLAYDMQDLEQHAWEVLSEVLNCSSDGIITDFRKRHMVGADGAIDWKKFVELKATGRALQSSIELTAAEFERAREKGVDFILALVSGLERGFTTEIRLIFDPANRVSLRPTSSIRLIGLAEAPAVVIRIADEPNPEIIAA